MTTTGTVHNRAKFALLQALAGPHTIDRMQLLIKHVLAGLREGRPQPAGVRAAGSLVPQPKPCLLQGLLASVESGGHADGAVNVRARACWQVREGCVAGCGFPVQGSYQDHANTKLWGWIHAPWLRIRAKALNWHTY